MSTPESRSVDAPVAGEPLRVSALVSTRNRAAKTGALLRSLLSCDGCPDADWEVVVADNDSTDETAAVVKGFAERHPGRVRYVYQSTRVKATGLNLAIRHSRGSLIALLDDDVRVAPNWLSRVVAAYRSDPDLAGFGGRVELFDPDDAPVAVRRSTIERLISAEPFDPGSIPVLGCNLSFRREVLVRVGPYDEAFGPGSVVGSGDDMDLLYRAYRRGCKLKYLPDVLVFHDHGRKPGPDTAATTRRFLRGRGGFYLKYGLTDAHILKCLCREVGSLLAAASRQIVRGDVHGQAVGELLAMTSGAWAFLCSRISPPPAPVNVRVFPAQDAGVIDRPPAAVA